MEGEVWRGEKGIEERGGSMKRKCERGSMEGEGSIKRAGEI